MGKYTNLQNGVYSIFDSVGWKAENIKAFPQNFTGSNVGNEYIRLNIISSGDGVNLLSTSGLLIIDIFVDAGDGITRITAIADILDGYLVGKTIANTGSIQMLKSSIANFRKDSDNPALFTAQYSIPLSYNK